MENRVHQTSILRNNRTGEQYEIVDAVARERLDAIESNMDSALAQVSAAESRMNTALQTQMVQIGMLGGRTDALEESIQGMGTAGAVTSVNGMTGDVTISATDVGALSDDTPIVGNLADMQPDEDHQTVTYAEKAEWYSKVSQEELSNATRTLRALNDRKMSAYIATDGLLHIQATVAVTEEEENNG